MADDVSIDVTCPYTECNSNKSIRVPSSLFDDELIGIAKYQIDQGMVCPDHQFIIYINKKSKDCAYGKIDIQDLSRTSLTMESDLQLMSIGELINDLGDLATLNLIHAMILDVPTVILTTMVEESKNSRIQKLIMELFPHLFHVDKLPTYINYKSIKKSFKKTYLVINEKGIVDSSPWEIKKFDIEEKLLTKSLTTDSYNAQATVFRTELNLIFKMVDFVNDLIKNDDIFEKDLKKQFITYFGLKKVSDYMIDFIKEVLYFRYSTDISKIKIRSLNKIQEGLW